jgi:tRNA-splicing ligase RtcB (3'-phosphate/5'-hydroxy nucleic acid ligase)
MEETMHDPSPPPIHTWLAEPMPHAVAQAIERLRRAPDVQHMAVMPDVHLATDVCIGVVIGTSHLIFPQAVGGDIGCGMLALGFDVEARALDHARVAGQILTGIGRAVPARRRNRRAAIAQPSDVEAVVLSHPRLEAMRRSEGVIEFATLGSGNHFIELQSDEEGRLWLMIHSGSRALGPAIRDHHLRIGERVGSGLVALDAASESGATYLADAAWARQFADASRRAMALEVATVLETTLGARACWDTAIATDHNHVSYEQHGGREVWVHRKGAMPAACGQAGVLPGSMGASSFHVEGRGNAAALCSSAHGAGRALSRAAARAKVSDRELQRQMDGVWFDYRLSGKLRDEAPAAYKDIASVLRAQRELVTVTRVLRPVLNYKGV